jgi:hypothetical protein
MAARQRVVEANKISHIPPPVKHFCDMLWRSCHVETMQLVMRS